MLPEFSVKLGTGVSDPENKLAAGWKPADLLDFTLKRSHQGSQESRVNSTGLCDTESGRSRDPGQGGIAQVPTACFQAFCGSYH